MANATMTLAEFKKAARAGERPTAIVRLQSSSALTSVAGRTAFARLSDGSVDRQNDTIDPAGWKFAAHVPCLYGHDPSTVANVVGRVKNIKVADAALYGSIEFADGAANPNAEAVYQLVKSGVLDSVSVGFRPLEWGFSKTRPNGIDFRRCELLECSIVAIPANENAIILAKAAGIDVDRLGLDRVTRRRVDAAELLRVFTGRQMM